MQHILVPIDFSIVSRAALKYAIQFADKLDADIICVHAFSFEETGMESIDMAKDKILKDLEWFTSTILDTRKVTIQYVAFPDAIQDTLNSLEKSKKIDLIVMGTEGSSGVKDFFVGTHTANTMYHTKIPLVIVPEHYEYRIIKNILFASDLKPLKSDVLDKIKIIVQKTGAILNVAHVQPNIEEEATVLEELHREDVFFGNEVPHYFKNVERSNISEGINYFLDYEDTDLLIMVRREHGLLDNILGKNHVEEFVNHPKVPLLIVHE